MTTLGLAAVASKQLPRPSITTAAKTMQSQQQQWQRRQGRRSIHSMTNALERLARGGERIVAFVTGDAELAPLIALAQDHVVVR